MEYEHDLGKSIKNVYVSKPRIFCNISLAIHKFNEIVRLNWQCVACISFLKSSVSYYSYPPPNVAMTLIIKLLLSHQQTHKIVSRDNSFIFTVTSNFLSTA